MNIDWPNKESREQNEICVVIKAYRNLSEPRYFVIHSKGEKPDYK